MAILPNNMPSGVAATGLPAKASRMIRDEAMFRPLRGRMETAVERLLAALDMIDGDPDLEADQDMDRADEEPSLGWTNRMDQSVADRSDCSDRELELGGMA